MAKVSYIQELACLDSEKRKKLDGFNLFSQGEAEDAKDKNMGKWDMKSLGSEIKYDLRKSMAWDSAFSSSTGILEVEELFNTANSCHSDNGCDILGDEEDLHLSIKYMKPEIKSVADDFNLRKSLAWDSAFFTSEGVLNHEELSLVNKGFKKSEMDKLPRIDELRISSESICTIDSDGSSLASLEVSMHQLREGSSTVTSSSGKQRYRNMQKVYSTKRMDWDSVPKLKVKSRPTSRKKTMNGNQPERIAKETSIPPSRKNIGHKTDKFSAGTGISDLSLHLKPPNTSGRVKNAKIAPTERVPLFSNDVNGESKIVKATRGKFLMENSNLFKTCSENSNCTTSSLEFSSLGSHICMNGSKGLSSTNRELSSCQSSLEFSIVKNDTLNSNNSSACNFTLVPPTKHGITNQMTPENCYHPTYSSVKRNCSCRSSSILSTDSFSPAPSTSTALVLSDLEAEPHGENNVSHEDKEIMCLNPRTEVKRSSYISFDTSRNVKPSGLRMPSPKIGFFDVDNSLLPMGKKSHSGADPDTQTLKDVTNSRTCPWKTRNSTISRTMKFGLAAVSKVGDSKNCLKNDTKMVNARAHDDEFEGKTIPIMDKI